MTFRTRFLMLVSVLCLLVTAFPGGAMATGRALDPNTCRLAIGTSAPVGFDACPGVRPGALVEIPHSGDGDVLCTMGFVFSDLRGHYLMSTAGHCVIGSGAAGTGIDGRKVWAAGKGPVALDSNGHKIGNYIFGVESTTKNVDFGLILLTVRPNPQMCHFGGPTGVDTSTPGFGSVVQLRLYGNALGLSSIVPARSGISNGMPEKDFVAAILPSFKGDSGGPVLDAAGQAVGYVVAFGISGQPGTTFIYRLAPQVGIAEAALHMTLRVVTAKTL